MKFLTIRVVLALSLLILTIILACDDKKKGSLTGASELPDITTATPTPTPTPTTPPRSGPPEGRTAWPAGDYITPSCQLIGNATEERPRYRGPQNPTITGAVQMALVQAQINSEAVSEGKVINASLYFKTIMDELDKKNICAYAKHDELGVLDKIKDRDDNDVYASYPFDLIAANGSSLFGPYEAYIPMPYHSGATSRAIDDRTKGEVFDDSCGLPSSGLYFGVASADIGGDGVYIDAVKDAIRKLIKEESEKRRRGEPRDNLYLDGVPVDLPSDPLAVKDISIANHFRVGERIVEYLREAKYCAVYTGKDEFSVKKDTNRFDETYDFQHPTTDENGRKVDKLVYNWTWRHFDASF